MSSHTPRTVWLLRSALFTEEVWLTRCQSSEVGLSFKTQCMYDTPTPDRHKQRSTRHDRSVVYLFLAVFVRVPWLFDYCWVEGIRAGFCALFPVILDWFIYVSKRPLIIIMMMMMMMMNLSIYLFVFCIFFLYTLTAHFRYTKRILRIQVHFILPLHLPSC